MDDSQLVFKLKQNTEKIHALQEAIELIEISKRLFQEKLQVLKAQAFQEPNPQKVKLLTTQAYDLYGQYQKTLKKIEEELESL